MKAIVVLVFLIVSISSYSQDIDTKKILSMRVPKSEMLSLRKCIINYAIDTGSIKSTNEPVDDMDLFLIKKGNKGLGSIYLFSIPSFNVHSDWGVAVEHKEVFSLYTLGYGLPFAVYDLLQQNGSNKDLVKAVESILSCVSDEYFEWKMVEHKNEKYYYDYANWYNIYQKQNLSKVGRREKEICKSYNPITQLRLNGISSKDLDTSISEWCRNSYGDTPISYTLYEVTTIDKHTILCLIESRTQNDEVHFDLCLSDKKGRKFYQTEETFIPTLVAILQSFSIHTKGFRRALECLCLLNMYYYGANFTKYVCP